jgi:hypothetical protein
MIFLLLFLSRKKVNKTIFTKSWIASPVADARVPSSREDKKQSQVSYEMLPSSA